MRGATAELQDVSCLESSLRQKGLQWIAGVDEVGRGPLAGPVVAAACLVPPSVQLEGIKDSKALSALKREKLFWDIIIKSHIGLGVVYEKEIDRINILNASLLAMREAVLQLPRTPDIVLVDGHLKIKLPIEQIPVIGGDAKLVSIGAASIVAKVTRDAIMTKLHQLYPGYGFDQHKGYPTPAHLAALSAIGPSPVHRFSFKPVSDVVRSHI